MPVMITLNKIKEKDPCTHGWRKALKGQGKTESDDKEFPLSDIWKSNSKKDVEWCFQCLPEYDHLWRKYSVWCARQVQHLMTDQRSIDALDVAWRHSNGEATGNELEAARTAAWAAWAAWAAAEAAARAAARAAAEAAARAARTATKASWYAGAAAWNAAEAAQEEKLKQILDAGEWVDD